MRQHFIVEQEYSIICPGLKLENNRIFLWTFDIVIDEVLPEEIVMYRDTLSK
jgi:hypothetical protein